MNEKQKARIEDEIRLLVSELIMRRVKDPRVANVSVTRVEASRDYSMAKIFYNVVGGTEDSAAVRQGLESSRRWMRSQIARRLRLRTVPELVFVYDVSLDRAMKIEELLERIHREDEDRAAGEPGGDGNDG